MTTNPKSPAFDAEGKRLVCEECTEWTHFDDLSVDPEDGSKIDVCKWCDLGIARPAASTVEFPADDRAPMYGSRD